MPVEPVTAAAAIAAAASMFGAHQRNRASAKEAARNRAFQADQARRQMSFQERMSSSAVQRQVADMRAAGINPILAGRYGGSSSPGGASGSGSMATFEDEITPAISTALQTRRLKQELKNMRASAKLDLANETVASVEQQRRVVQLEIDKITKQIMQKELTRSSTQAEFDKSEFGKMLIRLQRITEALQGVGSSAKSLMPGGRTIR